MKIDQILVATFILMSSALVRADLAVLDDVDLESISGKGIEMDANLVFSDSNASADNTWISYSQILVDELGNKLTDTNGDGYINYSADNPNFGTGNVQRTQVLNGYRVKYEVDDVKNYQIRSPAHIIIGDITGGISFTGLKFEMDSTFGYDPEQPLSDLNKPKAALKWTLPEKIQFDNLAVKGIYVSVDDTLDANDTFLFGLNLDGPVYLPSNTQSYVFVTSD